MRFTVTWHGGSQTFAKKDDAMEAARSTKGIVLVNEAPTGSVAVFRDGRELENDAAAEATREFLRGQKE